MGNNKQICRLCLELIPPEDGKVIEETKKGVLEILLINIDLNITDNAVACDKCLEQLQHCFDFKASCVYVDDSIAPFVDAHTRVDIKKVFEIKLDSRANVNLENVQICRLCMSVIEDDKDVNADFTYISDVVRNCLPEVDLNTVHDPIICKLCVGNMKRLNEFMKTCQDVEQRIQNYYQDAADHGLLGKVTLRDLLKYKDCDAISAPIEEKCLNFDGKILKCPKDEEISNIECEEVHIKEELHNGKSGGKKERRFKCQYCDHKCRRRTHLKRHILSIHKSKTTTDSEKVEFKCHCGYKSKRKCDLNKHMSVIHGVANKLQYCHYCDYKSDNTSQLKRHMLEVHKREYTVNNAKLYDCHYCNYKSKNKCHLQRHIATVHEKQKIENKRKLLSCHYCDYKGSWSCLAQHISAIHERERAPVHCCHLCSFKSIHARNLHSHLKRHSEKPRYKCPGCDRRFTEKWTLDDHLLRCHDNKFHSLITSKIHCCEFCTHKAVSSSNMKCHIASHHGKSVNTSPAEEFHCHNCGHVAFTKRSLKLHLLRHTNFRPYQCSLCEKGFKVKRYLDSHILSNHKENADMVKTISHKIYHCTLCQYETTIAANLRRHNKCIHQQ